MDKVDGFLNLAKLLESYAKMADPHTIKAAQEAGAAFFVEVMRARSSPRGRSRDHMLDTIDYEYDGKGSTYVGWKKFYGRLVESGHRTTAGYSKKKDKGGTYKMIAPKSLDKERQSFVRAQPHMKPEFEAQKDKIMRRMMDVYEGVKKT